MDFNLLSAPPVIARIYVYSSDATVYVALALTIIGIQALLWIMARHSADIEWWRAAVIGVLSSSAGVMAWRLLASESAAGSLVAAALIGGAFVTWILAGILYELEHWQRAVLSVASPLIGTLAMIGGLLIRNAIYSLTIGG